jgi:hypothetical protein
MDENYDTLWKMGTMFYKPSDIQGPAEKLDLFNLALDWGLVG